MDEAANFREPVSSETDCPSVCPLCLKHPSKYTCPRCNSRYCSVDCYKSEKHRDCSELFYKDCFMEGLKESSASSDEKRKMMDTLTRVEKETADDYGDDVDGEELLERLQDLDLDRDADKIWSRLTEKERKEFESMVNDGRLGNLVEVWQPWWIPADAKLVTPVDDDTIMDTSRAPAVKSDITPISLLLKTKPSADIRYNAINVLYAYAFICRLHNGDHVTNALESAQDMMSLCDVLGQGHVFATVGDAIQSCITKLLSGKLDIESTQEFNVSVIKDVVCMVSVTDTDNPLGNIMMALSDIYFMFKQANKIISKQLKSARKEVLRTKLSNTKSKFFHSIKKVEFLLSWAQSYGMVLNGLVPELDLEYSRMHSELEAVSQSNKQLEESWGGKRPKRKTLIQEL